MIRSDTFLLWSKRSLKVYGSDKARGAHTEYSSETNDHWMGQGRGANLYIVTYTFSRKSELE